MTTEIILDGEIVTSIILGSPTSTGGNVDTVNGVQPDANKNVQLSYDDLDNLPTLFSGDYDDLTDKPIIPSAVPDVTPYQFAFATQVNLTKPNGYAAHQLSGATEFSPLTTGAQHGYFNLYHLDLNGVTPTFSGFNNWDTNAEPDLTAGQINILVFTKTYNTYWYFWANSYTGTINDTTPPTLSDVSISNIVQTLAQINATSNEIATFYWANFANGYSFGSATEAQKRTIIENGTGAISFGDVSLLTATPGNDSITGLAYSTAYDTYYFAVDSSLNYSAVTLIEFSTIARTQLNAPVVTVASAGQTQLNISVNANASGVEVYISTTSGGTYTLYETLAAADLTCNSLTGLTQGTTRYFKAIAKGDNLSALDSVLSIEYSGTTSTITQLNAVTGLSSTPNTSTQNTLNWTDTNTSPNETYFRVRRSVNSDMSGASILTSTLAANSTQYVDSTATPLQLYYYDVMCVGDGSTTSDSNTAVISCQTKATPPTYASGATDTTGLIIGVIYSKTMPASPTFSGMSFSGTTSGTHNATGAVRDSGNTSKVNYSFAVACVNGETVTANYTAGNIVANDGGILANFSSQAVTNNVVSAGDYYRLNTYGTEFFVYDAKDAANFTLSGSDITAIKDGSGNSRDMSYLSGSNFVYNSANDNYTSNGGNQNGIYTPSSNIDLGSVHSIIWVGTFTSGVTQTVIGREPSTGGCQIKMGSSTTWVAYYPTSENVGPQKIWNPTTAYGAKHVFIITRNGATTNLYVDGTLISALGGTIDTTSSVIKGIGALALNDMLKGLINYQAAINVELTASQVTTISTALNARY